MDLTRYDAVFLDMDGVVHVGDEAVPGVPETIRRLRDRGTTVRFVTNNSRSTRATLVDRLAAMGISADVEDVVSAGWATADSVADRDAVSVVGTDGLAAMVRDRGVAVRERGPVDAVVVGHDDELTYDDLSRATRQLVDGADLIAVNADEWFPSAGGRAPGTGATVAALETASGVEATVVGKPEPDLFELALDGIPPERALMVGDNPEADVLGAARADVDAVLVTAHGPDSGAVDADPVATVDTLADLLAA